jgi:hypothetical protein
MEGAQRLGNLEDLAFDLGKQGFENIEDAWCALGRSLQSSTFRLNLSAFCRIGVH